jgi:RND family efflux transporter MFP subunit
MNKKIIIGILFVLIIGGGYFYFIKVSKNKNQTRYVLTKVERGTILVSVSGSGQISAEDQRDIKPKVAGEISKIFVEKNREVKAGEPLFELDKEPKERAVRDAEIALKDAKDALQKAKDNYEKLKRDLENSAETAYKNAFDALVETYKDLNPLISNLESIFKAKDYSSQETDLDYYISLVRSIRAYQGEINPLPYWTGKAEDKFLPLKDNFESLQREYWKLTQSSPREQIRDLLYRTYNFSNDLLDLIRQTSNLISEYLKIIDKEGLIPPISLSITNSQASQMATFDSTVSTLNSNLKKIRDTIDDLEKNSPLQIRDAELAIQTAQNNLTKAEDALSDAKENLKNCSIYAPFDGIISDVKVKKGDTVSTATILATIVAKKKIAEITLNEIDAAKVKVDQKVTLTFDALPDLTLTGKVTEIDKVGTVSQGVTSYGVKIALDSDDERIKPGMSVNAEIVVDVKPDVLTLPNSAIKSEGNLRYVQLIDAPKEIKDKLKIGTPIVLPKEVKIKNQPVKIGISSETMTEILSGVSEGDIVISSKVTPQTQTTQTQFRLQIPGMGMPATQRR